MIKRKIIVIGLTLALFSGGCTSARTDSSTGPETAAGDQKFQERIVTDAYGRQVKLPDKIEKIAAIGGAARILTYAGCAGKLVGITDMDKQNIAAMPYTVVNAGHFKTLTSVGSGGSNDTCYVESLVTLQPDVIFGLTDEDTIKNIAEKTGIPTIAVYPTDMFDPSFYFALELIGKVMGTEDHCTQVMNYVKACQTDLDRRTKDIPEADKPSVYTGAVSFRGAHGFEGTYAKYPPFVAIHAQNVVDETGQSGALLIELEKVTVWDPDIVFLNPANINLVRQGYGKNKAFYDGLQAVRNGRVYTQIPYNYNWTNMELAISDAYYAGKVIYPQQFTDIDPIQKANEIFKVMLGQPFYDQLVAAGYKFDKITMGE